MPVRGDKHQRNARRITETPALTSLPTNPNNLEPSNYFLSVESTGVRIASAPGVECGQMISEWVRITNLCCSGHLQIPLCPSSSAPAPGGVGWELHDELPHPASLGGWANAARAWRSEAGMRVKSGDVCPPAPLPPCMATLGSG